MRVGRDRQTETGGQPGLRGCGGEQIVAPHHLVDAGGAVVDHHRELVRRSAVAVLPDQRAAHHHVLDPPGDLPVPQVGDGHRRPVAPDPQGGRPARAETLGSLRLGQVSAGSRITARLAVRGGRRLGDLASGAEALVRLVAQSAQRVVVRGGPLGLDQDRRVEVQSQGLEIGSLPLGHAGSDAARVEILVPEQEPTPTGSGEQPGQHSGPQVAQVQVPGGARRVAPGTCDRRVATRTGAHRKPFRMLVAWRVGTEPSE